MKKKEVLREELLWLLQGGSAHADFETAIAHIPKKYYGAQVSGLPYTLWRQLQHMQLSQRDILEYIKNPDYKELAWPEQYWPQEKSPPNEGAWAEKVKAFQSDLEELKEMVQDPKIDLLASIPHVKNGPSYLRELLLVADHNSYHIGQIILLRGWLGIWKD